MTLEPSAGLHTVRGFSRTKQCRLFATGARFRNIWEPRGEGNPVAGNIGMEPTLISAGDQDQVSQRI